MKRAEVIQNTISVISKLPDEKLTEIADFATFLLKNYEENLINKGIQKIANNSKAFEFLNTEDELYSLSDIKVNYK